MPKLQIRDNVIARICTYCSLCRQQLNTPFVGVRVMTGEIRDYLDHNSEENADISLLCGAGLPANLEAWSLVEHPILGIDGKSLGILFFPGPPTAASSEALRPFITKIEEHLRMLHSGILTPAYTSRETGALPTLGKQVFDLLAQPLCIATADGLFKRANASFIDTVGLSEADLQKTSFLALTHPDDRMASLKALAELLDKGAIHGFRNRYLTKDSRYRIFEWDAILEEENEVFFASARDVTDKVRADETIHETNTLLSTVNKTLMGYISDKDSVHAFDGLLADLLEISSSEYGFICEVLREEDGTPYLKSIGLSNIAWTSETERLYQDHLEGNFEFRNLDTLFGTVITTGEPVFFNSNSGENRSGRLPPGHPQLNAFLGIPLYGGKELIGVVGIANNTEGYSESSLNNLKIFNSACSTLILAVRAERERERFAVKSTLESRRKTHAVILDAAMDSIIVLNHSGGIESANPASSELFARPIGALQGRQIWGLLSIDSREALQILLDKAVVDENTKARIELVTEPIDDRVLTLDSSLSAFNVSGNIYLVCVLRDVTTVRQLERELLYAKLAAENESKTKSLFLAHMSHELRTPITGVIGMFELANQASNEEEKGRYIRIAEDCSDSLFDIVNDLLDFSKIEANQLELEELVFNLRDSLVEVAEASKQKSQSKGLTFAIDVDNRLPAEMVGDFRRLRQVLVNLLSNALKFTDNGGISLTASLASASTTGTRIAFRVADSGIGISESEQQQIFQPFKQADSTITRRFGGTGLGLSIASRLIELMGGNLAVESRLGEGSSFYFEIDMDNAAAVTEKLTNARNRALEGSRLSLSTKSREPQTILLAEDNKVNQMLISSILIKRGHIVQVVENGRQAVELAAITRFDLILMDIQMPEMDGIEAARLIKANKTLAANHPRILALTAHATKNDEENCMAAGMDGFITKPVYSRDLISSVEGYANLL